MTSKAVQDGTIVLAFKISALDDAVLNFKAPWDFRVNDSSGIEFKQASMNTEDFKKDLSEFIFLMSGVAKDGVDSGDVEFSLKVFTCTRDKKSCFTDTHTGNVAWKKIKTE